jgi:hypothetical protein
VPRAAATAAAAALAAAAAAEDVKVELVKAEPRQERQRPPQHQQQLLQQQQQSTSRGSSARSSLSTAGVGAGSSRYSATAAGVGAGDDYSGAAAASPLHCTTASELDALELLTDPSGMIIGGAEELPALADDLLKLGVVDGHPANMEAYNVLQQHHLQQHHLQQHHNHNSSSSSSSHYHSSSQQAQLQQLMQQQAALYHQQLQQQQQTQQHQHQQPYTAVDPAFASSNSMLLMPTMGHMENVYLDAYFSFFGRFVRLASERATRSSIVQLAEARGACEAVRAAEAAAVLCGAAAASGEARLNAVCLWGAVAIGALLLGGVDPSKVRCVSAVSVKLSACFCSC